MSDIKHFLLVFDHEQERLIDQRSFGDDSTSALAAYAITEEKYRDNVMIDIVLIGSDSIETVRLTHANYFDGSVAVSKYLAGI
ncbi:MAG TPA: hypothetical protein VMB79_00960 [Jatrophihabitans sp.]|nr:hypothetical protein [Jatrophihabitans sp.]